MHFILLKLAGYHGINIFKTMKKYRQSFFLWSILIFCIGVFPINLAAQVNVNVQLPPGGMIRKENLWNITIVNNKDDILNLNIKLTLQDAQSGQIVMTASSGNIIMGKGLKIITNADVQPVLYNYNSIDLSKSFLPMGSYIACYQVYNLQHEAQEPLSNECSNLNIDPLSPPLLNTPADRSVSTTPYPLFTWMPPTPSDMFSDLNYDLVITEVLDGQATTEAIEYNTPVYTRNNLKQPNENYVSSFGKLDTGKVYAWQVTARNGFNYAVKTAVWTFSLNKEALPVSPLLFESYLLVDNTLKGTYSIDAKMLRIKFISYNREHNASVIIMDSKSNKLVSVEKQIRPGDNYYSIDLNNHFHKGNIYKVVITEITGESHEISFTIKK